jgi:hypothetical protein
MPTSRGSDATVAVGTNYAAIFDQGNDSNATAASIEAAGTDRILIKWTTMAGVVNYASVGRRLAAPSVPCQEKRDQEDRGEGGERHHLLVQHHCVG